MASPSEPHIDRFAVILWITTCEQPKWSIDWHSPVQCGMTSHSCQVKLGTGVITRSIVVCDSVVTERVHSGTVQGRTW